MKHINNIHISNFKSIRQASIKDCNVINVFIGKPNAGKSNLLEALGLKMLFQKEDNVNSSLNLKTITRFDRIDQLFYLGSEGEKEKGLIVINDNVISFQPLLDRISFTKVSGNDLLHTLDYDQNGTNILTESVGFSGVSNTDNSLLHSYKFNSDKFVDTIVQVNQIQLKVPFGGNLGYVAYHNSDLLKFIQNEFRILNRKFVLDSLYQIKIQVERSDGLIFEHDYELLADTLRRTIFYQAAILSNKETVLLFEEPEAHCFEPYIQEFTNSVKYDKNNNQFFIVTHSDFIIQEFLRDEESKAKTNIYLVNNVSGETKVKLMQREKNEDVYELGMNAFFNFDQLWENN